MFSFGFLSHRVVLLATAHDRRSVDSLATLTPSSCLRHDNDKCVVVNRSDAACERELIGGTGEHIINKTKVSRDTGLSIV